MGNKIYVIILAITFLITGCNTSENQKLMKENEELKKQIAILEKENKSLPSDKEPLSINYQDYKHQKRLVEKESKLLALPRKEAAALNIILTNTVVQVYDAAMSDNELWLYVSIPVYDTPSNYKGWILEKDSVPLNKENLTKVQSEVIIKAGAKLIKGLLLSSQPETLTQEERGRIEEKKDNLMRITFPGGRTFWVDEKHVLYPSIE